MTQKNKKPALFCDFDGLKFDTLQIHIEYINQKYGIQTVESDYLNNPDLHLVVNKYLPENEHFTIEYVYKDLGENLIASMDWHKEVKPFEDMPEIMKELVKKYEVVTVTARQKSGLDVIQYLINEHIPGCIENIHCVWKHLPNGKFEEISKKYFILNYEGEKTGFFDDAPKEILPLQNFIKSYLFDPTGLHDSNKEIQNRVRSWKEIGDLLL